MKELFEACKQGNLNEVKRLIKEGCDPKAFDNEPIRTASYYGHLDVVKYLVKIGFDPKVCDNWAIRMASYYGHLEVVKYLVSIGCDPKADYNWAIRCASQYDELELVKYLVEIGCDHKEVKKSVSFEVLQEVKGKLLFFLNGRLGFPNQNLYLKMDLLKPMFPSFTFKEIFDIIKMYITVMVSGSTTADKDFFDKYYKKKIDEYISKQYRFVIGGAKGVDTLTQQYLIDSQYDHSLVTVVDKGTQDNRLSKDFNHKNGFSSYPERDAWMTENSDLDLAVVKQYGGGGSGTFANIVRREFGEDISKGVLKLFRKNATPFEEK